MAMETYLGHVLLLVLFASCIEGQSSCPASPVTASMCVPGVRTGPQLLIDLSSFSPDATGCQCRFNTIEDSVKVITYAAPNYLNCNSSVKVTSGLNSVNFRCLMSGNYLNTSTTREGTITLEREPGKSDYDKNYCLILESPGRLQDALTVNCTRDPSTPDSTTNSATAETTSQATVTMTTTLAPSTETSVPSVNVTSQAANRTTEGTELPLTTAAPQAATNVTENISTNTNQTDEAPITSAAQILSSTVSKTAAKQSDFTTTTATITTSTAAETESLSTASKSTAEATTTTATVQTTSEMSGIYLPTNTTGVVGNSGRAENGSTETLTNVPLLGNSASWPVAASETSLVENSTKLSNKSTAPGAVADTASQAVSILDLSVLEFKPEPVSETGSSTPVANTTVKPQTTPNVLPDIKTAFNPTIPSVGVDLSSTTSGQTPSTAGAVSSSGVIGLETGASQSTDERAKLIDSLESVPSMSFATPRTILTETADVLNTTGNLETSVTLINTSLPAEVESAASLLSATPSKDTGANDQSTMTVNTTLASESMSISSVSPADIDTTTAETVSSTEQSTPETSSIVMASSAATTEPTTGTTEQTSTSTTGLNVSTMSSKVLNDTVAASSNPALLAVLNTDEFPVRRNDSNAASMSVISSTESSTTVDVASAIVNNTSTTVLVAETSSTTEHSNNDTISSVETTTETTTERQANATERTDISATSSTGSLETTTSTIAAASSARPEVVNSTVSTATDSSFVKSSELESTTSITLAISSSDAPSDVETSTLSTASVSSTDSTSDVVSTVPKEAVYSTKVPSDVASTTSTPSVSTSTIVFGSTVSTEDFSSTSKPSELESTVSTGVFSSTSKPSELESTISTGTFSSTSKPSELESTISTGTFSSTSKPSELESTVSTSTVPSSPAITEKMEPIFPTKIVSTSTTRPDEIAPTVKMGTISPSRRPVVVRKRPPHDPTMIVVNRIPIGRGVWMLDGVVRNVSSPGAPGQNQEEERDTSGYRLSRNILVSVIASIAGIIILTSIITIVISNKKKRSQKANITCGDPASHSNRAYEGDAAHDVEKGAPQPSNNGQSPDNPPMNGQEQPPTNGGPVQHVIH